MYLKLNKLWNEVGQFQFCWREVTREDHELVTYYMDWTKKHWNYPCNNVIYNYEKYFTLFLYVLELHDHIVWCKPTVAYVIVVTPVNDTCDCIMSWMLYFGHFCIK